MPFGGSDTLSSVWAAAPDDVWVSALGGSVHRWNGVAWSSTRPGAPDWLNGIWAAGPNDAWVVGKSAGLARFGANTSALSGAGNRVWAGNSMGIFGRTR